MRKANWNAERKNQPEQSPLLSASTNRYRVQPLSSAEANRKQKKVGWLRSMWNEPVNRTVQNVSALTPPISSGPITGGMMRESSTEMTGGGSGRRKSYGTREEGEMSDYSPDIQLDKSPALQRTSHAATTELQMLDTRRIWLLLCLPAIFVVVIFLFPPQWSIEIDTISLPFGSSTGKKPEASSLDESLSPTSKSSRANIRNFENSMMLHLDKSIQAMKYVQISVQLSEHADRTIPLTELKKIDVEIEPYITSGADNLRLGMNKQRVVSAITLDTSESFYFDYNNKSALVPSIIPLLYTSFTFGTIKAAPIIHNEVHNTSREVSTKSENSTTTFTSSDESYYTFDAKLSFTHRSSESLLSAHSSESIAAEGGNDAKQREKGPLLQGMQQKDGISQPTSLPSLPPQSSGKLAESSGNGLPPDQDQIISKVLTGACLKVASQSLFFTIFDVMLRSLLCVATVSLYYVWWVRNWSSLSALATIAEVETEGQPGEIHESNWFRRRLQKWYATKDWLVTVLSSMLPEQMTSAWMLFFLFMWQSPMDVILSALSPFEALSPPLHIHELAFHMKYAAKSGFLYCILVYIAGLKFYPGLAYHYYTKKRGAALDFDGVIGESEADDSSPGPDEARGRHKGFGLWSWIHEKRQGDAEGSNVPRAGRGVRRVWAGGRDAVKRIYRGAFSRQSLVAFIGGNNRTIGEGLLDADTSADTPSFGLPVHHCLSTEYFDFIWNKLLLLFACWGMQWMCWRNMRASQEALVAHTSAGHKTTTDDQTEQLYAEYVAWHNLMLLCVYGMSLLWAILIFYSSKNTNWHLKAINYGLSRHRHLSFRLFLSQVYIWSAILLSLGLFRYNECMIVLHKGFNFLRESTILLMLFSKPPSASSYYSFAVWEDKQRQLMTFLSSEYLPPFGFFTYLDLVSLSALTYTIAYAYLPPMGDEWQARFEKEKNASFATAAGAGSPIHEQNIGVEGRGRKYSVYSDSYTALERDLPVGGRDSMGRVEAVFCLETACRLLEISEQSYYKPSLLHLDKIGAYPLTDTDRAVLGREMRDRLARENSSDVLQDLDYGATDHTGVIGASSAVIMNPFEDGYDEVAAAEEIERRGVGKVVRVSAASDGADADINADVRQSNKGEGAVGEASGELNGLSPYPMNLEPLGVQLLSLFHDSEYQNLGFVARSLPSMEEEVSQRALGGRAVNVKEGGRGRLASLSCSASQSKLYICFRGTADITNMMTDLRAFPSEMMKVQEDCDFFRGLIQSGKSGRCEVGSFLGDSGLQQSSNDSERKEESLADGENKDDIGNSSSDPKMHVGFKEAYFHIRKEALLSVVSSMYMLCMAARSSASSASANATASGSSGRRKKRPLELVFCGHSLGGALAALLAYDLSVNLQQVLLAIHMELLAEDDSDDDSDDCKDTGHDLEEGYHEPAHQWSHVDVSVYTFGAPRTGNEAFCQRLRSQLPVLYRIELDGDMITAMPPHMTHAGDQVLVDPHGAGNLIVNPSAVEQNLLANHHSSVNKHTIDRYRSCLERCFTQEEFSSYVSQTFGSRNERLTAVEKQLAARGLGQSSRPTEVPDWMF